MSRTFAPLGCAIVARDVPSSVNLNPKVVVSPLDASFSK